MPLFVIPFPAIDPVAVALGAVRDPLVRARLHRRADYRLALLPDARGPPAQSRRAARRSTISSSGRRSASCSAGASATCCSTIPPITPSTRSRRSICGTAGCRSTAARSASRWRSCCSRGCAICRSWRSPTSSIEAMPIGLFFGRIANFINGELWGRVTDVPWAMVFPKAGQCRAIRASSTRPRCEGARCCSSCCFAPSVPEVRAAARHRRGIFLAGYAVARIVGRIVPPARRAARLPLSRHDDGTAPVDPAAHRRRRLICGRAPARLAPRRAR